jgi:hypothetical protein
MFDRLPPTESERHAMKARTTKAKFEVVHQDGECGGLWIFEAGKNVPCVAIWMDEQCGPVIGLHGLDCSHGIKAGLVIDQNSGLGSLYLLDSKNEMVTLNGDQLGALLALLKPAE